MLTQLQLFVGRVLTALPLTSGVANDTTEEKAESIVNNIITPVGNAVISVLGAVGIIFVAVGLIKSGIILADADKSGPEQTAKAKTVIKNNIIALIIILLVMVGLLTSLNTWLKPLLKNLIKNVG